MKSHSAAEFLGHIQTLGARTNDPETSASLSKDIWIKSGKNGEVRFFKISEEEASGKFKKTYLASSKAQKAREQAAKKIESALTEAGVKITDDIRNALPSKTSMGDFASLQPSFALGKLLLTKANRGEKTKEKEPVEESEVLSAVKKELSALDWSDPKCTLTLFRSNSESQKLMTGYLAGTFTKSAENCVANAAQSALKTLKATRSPDDTLIALHEAVLHGLEDVLFTPAFNQLVFKLIDLIDQVADEKLKDSSVTRDPAVVGAITKEMKEKVFATIFLRTLSHELAENLRIVENELKSAVAKETGKPAPVGFKPTVVSSAVQVLFGGVTNLQTKVGDGTGIKDTMPKYYNLVFDQTRNNLNSFVSLTGLRKDAGLT